MQLGKAIKIIPPTKSSEKLFRRDYYEAKIGKASARGKTSDEAINNLKVTVKQVFEGDYCPSLITFRGLIGIVWRELHGWSHRVLESDEIHPEAQNSIWSCNISNSQEEALRLLRFQLADMAWDGDEEYSPIIIGEEEQSRFGKAMRWQKRYRALKATGMDDNAIRNQLWDEGL
jgi:hypothetical protein